ncbi:uncharacterized protein [Acropora muricata]|uniref:uncharacterized protein n=1 Tax=Acropora muricata TaxID=159855 RepID=UPI0034E5F8E1
MFVWIHGKALPKQAWWRHHPVSTNRRPQPYQIEGRPTKEEERVRENNDVKEFIQTLDEPMVRKLCIRRLQRVVGSMDFMQGLLIMDESDVTPTPSTSTDLACSSNAGTPDPAPSPSNNAIPWCKCRVCQIMPQEIGNKCCGFRHCYNTHLIFKALLRSRFYTFGHKEQVGDIRNDRDDNSTQAFRKTG